MTAMTLYRINPSRNMRRFYRMDTEPDLFGGFFLIKQWGRIGTTGRTVAEHFATSGQAQGALAQHAARKRRRGYV